LTRLPLDQGIPRSTARILTEHGWDCIHVGDIQMSDTTDAEILEKGLADRRVVVTLDSDFHTQLAVTSAQNFHLRYEFALKDCAVMHSQHC